MRRFMVQITLMVCTLPGWAQQNAKLQLSQEDRDFLEMANKPVAITVPAMDQVRITKDLVYKRAGSTELKADVYRAANSGANRPAPVVIFIHGGVGPEFPVRPKDWGVYQSYGKLMAGSGFTAVTFNHRAGFPKTELPQAAEDLSDVMRFVRWHASEWNADGSRMCLVAFSAGGPLLSVVMRDQQEFVRCLVGMYPILDIQNSKLHREQMTPEELARYSPVEQIARNPKAPPILIARAGHDQIPELLAGLDRFISVALKSDANVTLMNNPGAPHGFDNKEGTERTREILHAVIRFLDEHLTDQQPNDHLPGAN
jgi:acetyl esterase/lipase